MVNIAKAGAVLLALSALAGCWNTDRSVAGGTVDLGSVSLGQQMIDLKTALTQDAITQDEYDRLKQALLAIGTACTPREPKD